MILEEISEYKRTLRLYINSLGAVGAFVFSVVQFATNSLILGAFTFGCGVYFSVITYLLKRNKTYLWKGRGLLGILMPTILYAMYANADYGIYWTYVGVISIFLMLELKDAYISIILFLAGVFYLADQHFSGAVMTRVVTTLLIVSIFAFCFSYLIDRLLNTLNTAAIHDPLTKALNRQTFHKSIETVLADHRRNQVIGVLFLFDLDHFKKVNDEHGHIAGDKVLREVAEIVHNRIRETDEFFRYGGEEFAILLRHTPLQNAAVLADNIRSLIEAHTFSNGLHVTISGGISEVDGTTSVTEWIERSDNALYEAKASGRNNIKIHIPPLKGWEA